VLDLPYRKNWEKWKWKNVSTVLHAVKLATKFIMLLCALCIANNI